MPANPTVELHDAARRKWINLIVPGAGLILAGRPLAGLATGIAFAAAFNSALALWLLVPDDFPFTAFWCGLTAALLYVVAQFLLLRAGADDQSAGVRDDRRAALACLLAALREGRTDDEAAARLQPLADADLHVAYRLAQSATLLGDARGARVAWERVQRLDPHHVYRAETVSALRRLRDEAPSDAGYA